MLQGMSERVINRALLARSMGGKHTIVRNNERILSIMETRETIVIVCYLFNPVDFKRYTDIYTHMNEYPARGKKLITCFGNLKFTDWN